MSEMFAGLGGMLGEPAGATLRVAADNRVHDSKPSPHPQATELLSQILAKLHDLDTPVVQILQCSAGLPKSRIARELAMASLYWLGRTLLVGLDTSLDEGCGNIEAEADAAVRAARRPFRETARVTRDAEWGDLFHARICRGMPDARSGIPPVIWLGELRVDFRMMLIDCGALSRNPIGVNLVPRCHGSLLTVACGQTTLAEIRGVARQVQLSGGTVLGTVLYNKSAGKASPPSLATAQSATAATSLVNAAG